MTNELLIQQLVDDGYIHLAHIRDAFHSIDRKRFVPVNEQERAYENYPLSIGYEQTISQPLTVAFMLELLNPLKGEKILDIGAGSGWQTALLAFLVDSKDTPGKVIAIERIAELKRFAEANIETYKFISRGLVEVIKGNGVQGSKGDAPFDKIIAAASGEAIPKAWKEQLKIGGRIVSPVGGSIVVLDKINMDTFEEKSYFGFSFVPLIQRS